MKKKLLSKDTIIITCKLYDQVLPQNVCYSSNKFDHSPPQVTFLSPKLRSFGQHHESRALAENKTGSPIKIDFRL